MTDLLLLPGDGIGPEVIAQVRRVAATLTPDLAIDERAFGGCSYDEFGSPLTDETLAWLDTELGVDPGTPAFVVVHHQPVPLHTETSDVIRLTDPTGSVSGTAK